MIQFSSPDIEIGIQEQPSRSAEKEEEAGISEGSHSEHMNLKVTFSLISNCTVFVNLLYSLYYSTVMVIISGVVCMTFCVSRREWWSSRSVCCLPSWSVTRSYTGFLFTSQILVSILCTFFIPSKISKPGFNSVNRKVLQREKFCSDQF